MLENVKQVTIGPLIQQTIIEGSVVDTEECEIDARLLEWGYDHRTVCHAKGEYARDGFCATHMNTLEEFWSRLRSWLRPHRGISQEKLPLYLVFFQFIPNFRARGKSVLEAPIGLLIAPPCNPS
jgi:transposase